MRLIDASNFSNTENLNFISTNENILIQSEDKISFKRKNFKIVSKKKPSNSQFSDLLFAFNVCRYTKSNAIVLASNKSTIGLGSGQLKYGGLNLFSSKTEGICPDS